MLPLLFVGGMLFLTKELLVINYELIIIIGVLLVGYFLVNVLKPIIKNSIETYTQEIYNNIENVLKAQLENLKNPLKKIYFSLDTNFLDMGSINNVQLEQAQTQQKVIEIFMLCNNIFNLNIKFIQIFDNLKEEKEENLIKINVKNKKQNDE